MTALTTCRRCQVPLLPGAGACPWCGVTSPAVAGRGSRVAGPTVTACWVLGSVGALAVTHELVVLLGRAIG